jgi:site-specific recombinase XerD
VSGNPVDGVKRPMANGLRQQPALGDAQARKLLEAPAADTLKGVRDRAILATLLYHYHGHAATSCAGCGSGTSRAARA